MRDLAAEALEQPEPRFVLPRTAVGLLLTFVFAVACTSSAAPPSLTSPEGVKAVNIQTASVTLKWTAGSGLAPTSFVILRDDRKVGTASATATSWTDQKVAPKTEYTYSIRAVAGSDTADSSSITVRTKTPPLAAALLSGDWTVTYTVISSSLSNAHPGQPLRPYTWTFAPSCRDKATCGGVWTIHFNDLSNAVGKFTHLNGHYLGSMNKVPLGICGSTNDKLDSATATIKVIRAAIIAGHWQADRFSGELQEYLPAENGCIASFLKSRLDGIRQH